MIIQYHIVAVHNYNHICYIGILRQVCVCIYRLVSCIIMYVSYILYKLCTSLRTCTILESYIRHVRM
ncbi:hypothetical protein L2E82_28068 [Cichorium intybus]|uniref:Uncharacterized protein n=1 Tax=Cichorium intybus TaxID=13427 RepID=A0ACB9CV08_CICIN|nr:hypothetical protein L2E82_28068 [Cichorium intybus]